MTSAGTASEVSSPGGGGSLPNELVGKIIQELAQRVGTRDGAGPLEDHAIESLRQCSLVNRDFRVFSQQQLFMNITIRRGNMSRASALLRDAPHLCDLVRSLNVECSYSVPASGVLGQSCDVEESEMCANLLRCRNIARIGLYGPFRCWHWTEQAKAHYAELLGMPALEHLGIDDMFGFPISLLQKATSLQTLSFNANFYHSSELPKFNPKLATGSTPVEKTVFLRQLRVCDETSSEGFMQRILSPSCCLDVRKLCSLTVVDVGRGIPQSRLKVLEDVIHLCRNSLTSFEVSDVGPFLSLKCDPLLRLQHFKFQLLPNRALTARPQDRYPLVPSIVNWLKRYAPNVTQVKISCYGDVVAGGSHSEQWISVDKAFTPSSSGLKALKTVEFTNFVWSLSFDQRHADEQIRLARPFLSVLQPKLANIELTL